LIFGSFYNPATPKPFLGIGNVEWGNKDPETCILSLRNGYAGNIGKAQKIDDDITGCVSWTNTYGSLARFIKKQRKLSN